MRKHWVQQPQCSVYEATNLDCIAVTLRHAFELWGYGRADVPALALPDPAQIEPVGGWDSKGKHGYMAFSIGKAGRLVGLADLVQWLIDTQEVPCSIAVEDVCQKLRAPDAASWLYIVKPGELARQLTNDDDFSYRPVVIGYTQESAPKNCGLAGALLHMREYWAGSSSPIECDYIGSHTLDPLAIRMDVAHGLWGWGSVVSVDTSKPVTATAPATKLARADVNDFASLCCYFAPYAGKAPHERPNWDAKWVDYARAEVKAHDATYGRGGLTAVGRALGMTYQRVSELLNKHPEPKADPFKGLGSRAA
ncbi:hypothetical protein EAG14_08215 [Acidovorax sp. 1608163]|nr:hypothetical protein EAG14_08215 [Acidovorax sp. 1608163]